MPLSDLAAIACGGKTEQSCSQFKKKVNIQGVVTPPIPVFPATAGVVVTPLENGGYICESSECKTKEMKRMLDRVNSWGTAVTAAYHMLRETRCDHCFLFAPLTEVHRSKCRTKNYCSQLCKDCDDAVHKVCCNPDKELRRIEERKVRIGGQYKVDAANARLDSLAESVRTDATLNPDLAKKWEIVKKTKKTENEQIAMKNRAAAKIYEVD